MGDAVEEVGGAIQRIDHPAPFPIAVRLPAFLTEKPPARAGLRQFLPQHLFGAEIGLGHEVARPLGGDLQVLDLPKIPQQPPPDLLHGLVHDIHGGGQAGRDSHRIRILKERRPER